MHSGITDEEKGHLCLKYVKGNPSLSSNTNKLCLSTLVPTKLDYRHPLGTRQGTVLGEIKGR